MKFKTCITRLEFETKTKKKTVVENFLLSEEIQNYLIGSVTIEESDEKIAKELIKQGFTKEKPFNIFVDDLYPIKNSC